MGRQRNRPQMKEQENSPEELSEMEARNLSDREIREMIIRMLNSMKKDTETTKKDQSEINNAISEIKILAKMSMSSVSREWVPPPWPCMAQAPGGLSLGPPYPGSP